MAKLTPLILPSMFSAISMVTSSWYSGSALISFSVNELTAGNGEETTGAGGRVEWVGKRQDWDRESWGTEPVGQAHQAEIRVSKQRSGSASRDQGQQAEGGAVQGGAGVQGQIREECTNFRLW